MGKNKKRRQREKRRLFESKHKTDSNFNNNNNNNNKSNNNSNEMNKSMKSVLNPFELHRNKVKHNVIGRKLGANECGKPGLSRNRAFNKRKETIFEEYKQIHKSGKGLQDLRIKDNEKRIRNRFTEIDKSIEFSKNDNLILTHKGKHLNDFMNDRIASDDEDIDLFNRPDYVESSHFGGGSDGRPKSANDFLDEIMNQKREKQLENEANIALTAKLDNQWNDIKGILRHKGVQHEVSHTLNEDYDILVKQLMFEDNNLIHNKCQITHKSDKSVENETDSVKRSADSLLKDSLKKIENETDWTIILVEIKDLINNCLPKITNNSLNVLFEKYQTITETKSDLTTNNMAFLVIGSHLKQTQLMVQIILVRLLSQIKFNTYQEIGQILVIIRFLLILSNGKYIPEIFDSLINVMFLAQHKDAIELRVKHRLKCSVECILAINEESIPKNVSLFKTKHIFDGKLNHFDANEEIDIKAMLLSEALKIADEVYDSYSTIPSFDEIITPLKSVLSQLSSHTFTSDIKHLLNNLLLKYNKEKPKVALQDSRPKPFMLPMFEPKFDDSHSNTASEKKKLVKKYKRELKGAQRELRKDSLFMRKTWINEIQENDSQRKRKVKELFGDLAVQQSLYKKKRK